MGLETPWGAWQLDQVTLIVGRRVQKNVDANKPPFDGLGKTVQTVSGYRKARLLVKKKVKIKPDGTW